MTRLSFSLLIILIVNSCVYAVDNLSGMAAGIVEQAGLARQATASKDRPSALDHVRQALILASDIERQTPAGETPIVVPISKETERTATYSLVKPGKDGQITTSRIKKHTSIREVTSEVNTTSLNVTSAAGHLRLAQAALEREEWILGDSELAAVPNSVMHQNSEGNMPLLKARENLMLARARVLEDKPGAAEAPLRAAAQALAEFERLSPGPRTVKAEAIRQEIDVYVRHVREDHANAIAQIDLWLDPINEWSRQVYGNVLP